MEEQNEPVANEAAPPERPTVKPRRKKVPFKITDKEKLARDIIESLEQNIQDRQERQDKRKERTAKLRGWLPGKEFPWADCANFWLPLMLTYSLRTKSTLENAVKSMRPAMNAKALQRTNIKKQKKIDDLLDYQLFTENRGEKFIDAYVSNFVEDEAAFVFCSWVRRAEGYRDIRIMPSLETPPEQDPLPELIARLVDLFPTMDREKGSEMLDEDGWEWKLEFIEENNERNAAEVRFYEREDGKLEAHISYSAIVFDGPAPQVLDWEDVVFPVRSGNLQPAAPENPYGAPYVDRICKMSLDAIKRGMEDRTYDQLSEEDFEEIKNAKSATGSGRPEEEPKEHKDSLEGTQSTFGGQSYDDRQVIEHYGRLDADGDGFDEDVIVWVERDTKKVMKTCFLTEMYPGLPIRRPLSSESFIPVPNRIYGISLPELLESLQDICQMLLNQHIDWGTIVNVPFFFYRAASGMKPETIRLNPGDGYPLDDPSRDVHFPTFQQRGDAYTINTMNLLQSFAEKLAMIGDVQFGRVPSGKSAALRTVGTTMSLIAQGDVRSEQVLRRLFHGLADVYQMMHRLNQRYLPEKKEIRLFGVSEQGKDPYTEIEREKDIDASVDFEFKATMLNTNKQVLSQQLQQAMAIVLSPLAVQAGIVTEAEVYALIRDWFKASDLDPDQYLARPAMYAEKVTAEEAVSAIIRGELLDAQPLEAPEEHLQKLMAYQQSDQFGFVPPDHVQLFGVWVQRVQQIIMRKQALMMMAQQQQMMGGGGTPTSANPEAATDMPPVENNEVADKTLGMM
mgnify:FL=1